MKSAQGYLKCQHCGTLLRITSYGKQFWFFFIPTLVLLALLVLVPRQLESALGINWGILWVGFLVVMVVIFTLGVWNNAQVEKVETDTNAEKKAST